MNKIKFLKASYIEDCGNMQAKLYIKEYYP